MSYVHLFYIKSTYNMYIWFLLLYYKMIKRGNKFEKAKHISNMPHIYWINTDKGAIHKVDTLKWAKFLFIPDLPRMRF